jgi:hypothetical protein
MTPPIEKNFSFRDRIRRPWEILLSGSIGVRGAPPRREEVVRFQRTMKGRRCLLLPTLNI